MLYQRSYCAARASQVLCTQKKHNICIITATNIVSYLLVLQQLFFSLELLVLLCMVVTFLHKNATEVRFAKILFFLPVFTSRDPETDFRSTERQSDDLYSSQGFVSGLRSELRKQNFKGPRKTRRRYFFSLLGLGRIQLNSQICT